MRERTRGLRAGLACLDPNEGRLLNPPEGSGGTVTVVHDPWRPVPAVGGHLSPSAGPCDRSSIDQRSPAEVSWTEVIRAITPDHAVLINRQNRRGSMIEAGMSMFILETEPAGYVLIAANEAEKASNITLVDVKAVGAFGRLTLAGREGDVEEAAAAAMRAIDLVNRRSTLR